MISITPPSSLTLDGANVSAGQFVVTERRSLSCWREDREARRPSRMKFPGRCWNANGWGVLTSSAFRSQLKRFV